MLHSDYRKEPDIGIAVGKPREELLELERHRQYGQHFYLGLDLGQEQNYSALSVLEKRGKRFTIRHLERIPLGTIYPNVVRRVFTILARPLIKNNSHYVIIDYTGVGHPVVQRMRDEMGLSCEAIGITSGDKVSEITDDRGKSTHTWHVPRQHLLSNLKAMAEDGTLDRADDLNFGDILDRELRSVDPSPWRKKRHASESDDGLVNPREKEHDDLVFSIALAAWWGSLPDTHRPIFRVFWSPGSSSKPLWM